MNIIGSTTNLLAVGWFNGK